MAIEDDIEILEVHSSDEGERARHVVKRSLADALKMVNEISGVNVPLELDSLTEKSFLNEAVGDLENKVGVDGVRAIFTIMGVVTASGHNDKIGSFLAEGAGYASGRWGSNMPLESRKDAVVMATERLKRGVLGKEGVKDLLVAASVVILTDNRNETMQYVRSDLARNGALVGGSEIKSYQDQIRTANGILEEKLSTEEVNDILGIVAALTFPETEKSLLDEITLFEDDKGSVHTEEGRQFGEPMKPNWDFEDMDRQRDN